MVYSIPNNLLEADPHTYLRELWWFRSTRYPRFLSACGPGLATHRAAHSEKAVPAHWPPYITETGLRVDSTDGSHYYRPATKSSHRGHRDARICARFFRFPRGPLIHLAACKERKRRECGCLCFTPGGRGSTVHWGLSCYWRKVFFSTISERQK